MRAEDELVNRRYPLKTITTLFQNSRVARKGGGLQETIAILPSLDCAIASHCAFAPARGGLMTAVS